MYYKTAPLKRTISIDLSSRMMKQYSQWTGWLLQCRASFAEPTHTSLSPALCSSWYWDLPQLQFPSIDQPGGKCCSLCCFDHWDDQQLQVSQDQTEQHELSIKTSRVSVVKLQNSLSFPTLPAARGEGGDRCLWNPYPCKPGGDALCHITPSVRGQHPWLRVKCSASRRSSSVLQIWAWDCTAYSPA